MLRAIVEITKAYLNLVTDGRTDGRTSQKQYVPSTFFKVGGITAVTNASG